MMRQRGVTLLELIITIVVISIGVVGILNVVKVTTHHSADPMVQQQAMIIAGAYLEEILAKAYADPEGESGSCEEGLPAVARALYDDINDYGCISGANSDAGARDQFGNAIGGLEGYTISVDTTTATLDAAVNVWRVAVRVVYGDMLDVTLVGYRADY